MMNKTLRIILAVGALAVLVAFFAVKKDKQNTSSDTITAAYVPAGFYAPIVIANEKGFFEEEGYKLELKRYNNNSLMINSFINGALDLTAQSSFTMFPVAEQNSGRFSFIYGQYANSYFFIAASDSGIETLKDMRGKTIGAWQSPTAVAYINLMLGNEGLKSGEYRVERFAVSDVAANLTSEVVDAVFVFDFQAAALVESGQYKIISPNAQRDLLASQNLKIFNGGGMISTEVLKKSPRKSKAIKNALAKAIKFIDENPMETRLILSDLLGVEMDNISDVKLDEFVLLDEDLLRSAGATYKLLESAGVVEGGHSIGALFSQ